ncbi:MAG: hypothetical protein UZ07_CHB004000283 [Chlorobi bacterium OLB7]|nr:MAG: hypothetical protein UZ07_CHB004000283 [Chlorobi bacterium OLB7]
MGDADSLMMPLMTDDKVRALRRMKRIATGAFLLMTAIFFVTNHLGNQAIFWVVRWDHVNAFAEAAMVGALADWFAVVALFRHPLGIPIWHTAIIPNKKDEIGRNLGTFVETRLLSVENLRTEIGRFSAANAALGYLDEPSHRQRAAELLTEGIATIVRQLDDEQVQATIAEAATDKLKDLNASTLLGNGLELIVQSGRHQQIIDSALTYLAQWVPTRRDMIRQFIERSLQRTLKWGSNLVPNAVVERATDQVLTALIEVLQQAAADPAHPMREDLNSRAEEWVHRLQQDEELGENVNRWKNDLVENPTVRGYIAGLWISLKEWMLADAQNADSTIRSYVLRGIESFHQRLTEDQELRQTIDTKLRSAVISVVSNHHSAIGGVISRIVDSWDGQRLSREIELNLGRDLQYIRLNGTFIGGIVGLLIHLVKV